MVQYGVLAEPRAGGFVLARCRNVTGRAEYGRDGLLWENIATDRLWPEADRSSYRAAGVAV